MKIINKKWKSFYLEECVVTEQIYDAVQVALAGEFQSPIVRNGTVQYSLNSFQKMCV